jgi:hypothetical protein
MKQLKRLHLSNLKTTEMGKLWGGYDLPEVVVTPKPTTAAPYIPDPAVRDATYVTPPLNKYPNL